MLLARLTLARYTLARMVGAPPRGEVRPFIVAGPPRSGTSLLGVLLSRAPNVVLVNEPAELRSARLAGASPAGLLRGFIRETAVRALSRGVVRTKADPDAPGSAARPTTDTMGTGWERRDVPVTIDPTRPLAVGVKEALPFVDHADSMLRGEPALRAVLIVREPHATLRSWRARGVGRQWLAGSAKNPRSTVQQSAAPAAGESDRLARLAAYWSAAAQACVRAARAHPDRVMLVRYDALVNDPASLLPRLLAHIGCPDRGAMVDVSDVRRPDVAPPGGKPQGYADFDISQKAMIQEACAESWREVLSVTSRS